MVAPNIEFWNSTSTVKYTTLDYGSLDAGQTTAVTTINIWNDKGTVLNSSTANGVTITTMTSGLLNTGSTLVDSKWYNVECTSYGDAVYTAVGGLTTKAIGYASANQTIPKNQKAVVLTKLIVPSGASTGIQNFYIRVTYTYT